MAFSAESFAQDREGRSLEAVIATSWHPRLCDGFALEIAKQQLFRHARPAQRNGRNVA
jgi:hypothetical protein